MSYGQNPYGDNQQYGQNPYQSQNPYAQQQDQQGGQNPYAQGGFGPDAGQQSANPYSQPSASQPIGQQSANPYSQPSASQPFGQQGGQDQFAQQGGQDQFAQQQNPYAQQQNPYGEQQYGQQASAAAPDMSWQEIPDHGIKVFTLESIPGESDITALGEVVGVAQRPRHRNEETLTRAHQEAVQEAVIMAKNSNADAIIGLRYTEGPESVVAYGTAVTLGSSASSDEAAADVSVGTPAAEAETASTEQGDSFAFSNDRSPFEQPSQETDSFGTSQQDENSFQSDSAASDQFGADSSQSSDGGFGGQSYSDQSYGSQSYGDPSQQQGQEAYGNPYEQQSGEWPFRGN